MSDQNSSYNFVVLNVEEIKKQFSEEVYDPILLYCFLDKLFYELREEEVHVVASVLLYKLVREEIFKYPVVAAIQVTDAFLKLNGKTISLSFINDPEVKRDAEMIKGMFVLDAVYRRQMDVGDLKAWMLWHIVDSDSSNVWCFAEENPDFMKMLERFKKDAPLVKAKEGNFFIRRG